MSPLNARRKTNHGQSISRNPIQNNFSLQRDKIPRNKQRNSKILNPKIQGKIRRSNAKDSTAKDNRSGSSDHYLSFQHQNRSSSKMVDHELYTIRSLVTRGLRIYHMANTLSKILPPSVKYRRDDLKDILRDKFLLSGFEAGKFADYLFHEAGNVLKLDFAAQRI